jgi:hypothetical protein
MFEEPDDPREFDPNHSGSKSYSELDSTEFDGTLSETETPDPSDLDCEAALSEHLANLPPRCKKLGFAGLVPFLGHREQRSC